MPKLTDPYINKCPRIHSCRYAVRDTNLNNGKRCLMCGYMLITGEPRGCSPADCDKFLQKTQTRYRRRGMTIIHRKDDVK